MSLIDASIDARDDAKRELIRTKRELIRTRTGEGRVRAKASGRKMGRAYKLMAHQQ